MSKLPFVKMHGCGNDYIYIVADRLRPCDPAALARRLSDRRFGIGGDGMIMLCPSDDADMRMEMYNADGSRGEMCGNGIRCVARLCYEVAGSGKNPIAVDTEFARLGRQFEHHPFFPRRVNTEFILPLSRNRLKMRVWERGSGETLACGTGACAALVAAVSTGRSDRAAAVELRGGTLEIEWRERGAGANHVFMTGEAVRVFEGEIELGDGELVAAAAGGRS
jgi:diaminopimelate epimerase